MTPCTHVAMLKGGGKMSNGEVDDEIVLPGVVRGSGAPAGTGAAPRASVLSTGSSNPAEPEGESDEEEVK